MKKLEIKNIQTFTSLVEAINKFGIRLSEEEARKAQDNGLLPVSLSYNSMKGKRVKVVIDMTDEMPYSALAYNKLDIPEGKDHGIYRIIIGPRIIKLARRYNSIFPISFALKHEIEHFSDHIVPHEDPELWNVATDVVINERIFQELPKYASSEKDLESLKELKSMVLTLNRIREQEQDACSKCKVPDCDKYLIKDDLLRSLVPEGHVYKPLFDLVVKDDVYKILLNLAHKCQSMKEVVKNYVVEMKTLVAWNGIGFDYDKFVNRVPELPYNKDECEKMGYYNIYGHCLKVRKSDGELKMEYSTGIASDGTLYNEYYWYLVQKWGYQ